MTTFDIRDLGPKATMGDLCHTLGELLELGRPLPERAAVATVTRRDYARHLLAARGNPALLEHLIASAPPPGKSAARFAIGGEREATEAPAPERSSASLVLQASRSLMRWAGGSFKTVDDGVYARRMEACGRCEHLRAPFGNVVYDILRALDPAAKVCGVCGCVAAKKARLPHEECPAADPSNPKLSRWGEPSSTFISNPGEPGATGARRGGTT